MCRGDNDSRVLRQDSEKHNPSYETFVRSVKTPVSSAKKTSPSMTPDSTLDRAILLHRAGDLEMAAAAYTELLQASAILLWRLFLRQTQVISTRKGNSCQHDSPSKNDKNSRGLRFGQVKGVLRVQRVLLEALCDSHATHLQRFGKM